MARVSCPRLRFDNFFYGGSVHSSHSVCTTTSRMPASTQVLRLLQRASRGGLLLRRRGLSTASAAPASSITSVLEKYGLPPTAAAPSANAAAVERQLCFLKVLGVPNLASAVQRDPQLLERDPRASAPHVDYLLSLGIADIGPHAFASSSDTASSRRGRSQSSSAGWQRASSLARSRVLSASRGCCMRCQRSRIWSPRRTRWPSYTAPLL